MKRYALCEECGRYVQVCKPTPIENHRNPVYRKHRALTSNAAKSNWPNCPGSRMEVPVPRLVTSVAVPNQEES